jgi:hypothetical protein
MCVLIDNSCYIYIYIYIYILNNNIIIQARREGQGTTISKLREDLTMGVGTANSFSLLLMIYTKQHTDIDLGGAKGRSAGQLSNVGSTLMCEQQPLFLK